MANSPGGVEQARVAVRVVPDTSKFPAELRADLRRIRQELKVSIPVELDTSGIIEHAREATAEAQAAAGKVHIKTEVDRGALRDVTRTLTNFASGISSVIGRAIKGVGFAALGLEASGSVVGILSLTGALTSVVGVIGLIPAGIAGAVSAIGALALGMHGFGTALGDVGDTAKFNQDLKNLAPSAAAAARAVKSILPQLRSLQRAVQQHLFAGLAADIRQVARVVIPPLKAGLKDVSDGLNAIIHDSLGAFGDLARAGVLQGTFANIATSLKLIAPAFGDFIRSFGILANIGSSFFPGFAKSIADAAAAFQAFVSTPAGAQSVRNFIQTGLVGFGQLFSIIKSTAEIFGGFIRAAQAATSGGALGGLAAVLQHVADVVNSPAFQTGLTEAFRGIADGTAALNQALTVMGPLVATLGPLIGSLASAIGRTLGAAIEAVAPALTILLKALVPQLVAGLSSVVPTLVRGFGRLAPVLADIATTIAQNKPLLAGLAVAAAALVGPFTAAAVAALLIVANFASIKAFVTGTLIPVFQQVAGVVVSALQPTIQAVLGVGQAFAGFGATVIPIVQSIVAIVVSNWPQISQIILQVMSTVQSIVVLSLTVLMREFQVITIAIKVIWAIFGNTILAVVQAVFPAILGIIRGALNIIQGVVRFFTAVLKGDWSGAWDAIKQIVRGAWEIITSVISGAFKVIWAIVRTGVAKIGEIIAGLAGLIRDATVGLLTDMFNLGSDLIAGIVNGIKNAAGNVADAVKGVIHDGIKAGLKVAGIGSPSRVFAKEIGEPISQGIALGVRNASGLVSDAVGGAVTPPDLSGVSAGAGGGGGRGAPLVNVEHLTVADVEAMAKALAQEQRDAATIENLQAALVGV